MRTSYWTLYIIKKISERSKNCIVFFLHWELLQNLFLKKCSNILLLTWPANIIKDSYIETVEKDNRTHKCTVIFMWTKGGKPKSICGMYSNYQLLQLNNIAVAVTCLSDLSRIKRQCHEACASVLYRLADSKCVHLDRRSLDRLAAIYIHNKLHIYPHSKDFSFIILNKLPQ